MSIQNKQKYTYTRVHISYDENGKNLKLKTGSVHFPPRFNQNANKMFFIKYDKKDFSMVKIREIAIESTNTVS